MSLIFPFYGDGFFASLHLCISIAKRPSFTILTDVHQISGLHLWPVFRRKNVVMGIDVQWVSLGRKDVVSYHKWMTQADIYPMHNNTNAHSSSRKDTGKYRYQLLDKQHF